MATTGTARPLMDLPAVAERLGVNDRHIRRLVAERRIPPLPSAGAQFHALSPLRFVDTRDGTGGSTTPWGGGETRTATVAGVHDVPANATAIVVNITVVNGTRPSHLTAFPGPTMPLASNLNFRPGQVIPNLAVVKVGADHKISVFNNAGDVDVLIDVVGYYSDS